MALDVLSTTFKRYRLEINISKTKIMVFNHNYINEEYPKKIFISNKTPIKKTTICKYKNHSQEIRNWGYTSILSNASFRENDENY